VADLVGRRLFPVLHITSSPRTSPADPAHTSAVLDERKDDVHPTNETVGPLLGRMVGLLDVRLVSTDDVNVFGNVLDRPGDGLPWPPPVLEQLGADVEESSDHVEESRDHVKESRDHVKESRDHVKESRDHVKESSDDLEKSSHYVTESLHYVEQSSQRRLKLRSVRSELRAVRKQLLDRRK